MAELPQEKPQWRQDPVIHCNESEPSDSLLEHPQEPLWPFGARALRFGLPVSFRGSAPAMTRMASASAVTSALAVAERRSVYHRAKGTTAPGLPVNSAAAIDSVFFSAD
jgi:hypothetical protein